MRMRNRMKAEDMGGAEGDKVPQGDGRTEGGRGGGFGLIAAWTAGGMGAFAWLLTDLADRLDSRAVALLALVPSVIGFAALLVLTVRAAVEMTRSQGDAGTKRRGPSEEDEGHS